MLRNQLYQVPFTMHVYLYSPPNLRSTLYARQMVRAESKTTALAHGRPTILLFERKASEVCENLIHKFDTAAFNERTREEVGKKRVECAGRWRSKYLTESRFIRSSPFAVTPERSHRRNVSIATNRSFIAIVRDIISEIDDLILPYQKFYETKYNIQLIPKHRIKFNDWSRGWFLPFIEGLPTRSPAKIISTLQLV